LFTTEGVDFTPDFNAIPGAGPVQRIINGVGAFALLLALVGIIISSNYHLQLGVITPMFYAFREREEIQALAAMAQILIDVSDWMSAALSNNGPQRRQHAACVGHELLRVGGGGHLHLGAVPAAGAGGDDLAGRLDVKIKFERPDAQATCDIFSKYLVPSLPLADEVAQAAGGSARRVVPAQRPFRSATAPPTRLPSTTSASTSAPAT
jgi:hypothetical protein